MGTTLLDTALAGKRESQGWEQARPSWVAASIDTLVSQIWGGLDQVQPTQHMLA